MYKYSYEFKLVILPFKKALENIEGFNIIELFNKIKFVIASLFL